MTDAVEIMFLGQSMLLEKYIQRPTTGTISAPVGPEHSQDHYTGALHARRQSLRHTLHALVEQNTDTPAFQQDSPSTNVSQKRKVDHEPPISSKRSRRLSTNDALPENGPLPETFNRVLLTYFKVVHPWVPVLHPATFTKRVAEPSRTSEDNMLLKAILACSSRYLPESEITDISDLHGCASIYREDVMAAAVEDNTIQSLQALILLIFDSVSPVLLMTCV